MKYQLSLTSDEMATLVMCVGASSGLAQAHPNTWRDMAETARTLGLGSPIHEPAALAAFSTRLSRMAADQDRAAAEAMLKGTN